MKTSYKIVLVLAATAAVLVAVNLPCEAVEKKGEDIWLADNPNPPVSPNMPDVAGMPGFRRHARYLEWLKENYPEEAKELEKLHKESMELFKKHSEEFRRECKGFREYGKRFREHSKRFKEHGRRFKGRRERPEYFEWLEKHYPEQAEELSEMRGKHPELYRKRLEMGHRRHRRIMEAERDNPELAKVLKESMELKKERDALLEKIKTADKDEKKVLAGELQEVVSKRFDLIVKRKQIRYEHLHKKLEKLEEKVKRNEVELGKWKETKDAKVKERLEELMGKGEKFSWD